MKRLLATAALTAVLVSPSAALTLEQAQAELAGMYCDGSRCVSYVETSTVVDLPDIDLPDTYKVKSFGGQTIINWHHPVPDSLCGKGFDWACDGEISTVLSTGIQRKTVTIDGGVLDGGTRTDYTCERTKKVLTYNGPNTDRANAWSIETTVAAQSGMCP